MYRDSTSLRDIEMRAVDFVMKQLPADAHEKRTLKDLFLDIHTQAMFSLLDKKTINSATVFNWSIIRPFLRVSEEGEHLPSIVGTIGNIVDTIKPNAQDATQMAYDMMSSKGLARHKIAAPLFERMVALALENTQSPLKARQDLSERVLQFIHDEAHGMHGKSLRRVFVNISNMALRNLGRAEIEHKFVNIEPPMRKKFTWPKHVHA